MSQSLHREWPEYNMHPTNVIEHVIEHGFSRISGERIFASITLWASFGRKCCILDSQAPVTQGEKASSIFWVSPPSTCCRPGPQHSSSLLPHHWKFQKSSSFCYCTSITPAPRCSWNGPYISPLRRTVAKVAPITPISWYPCLDVIPPPALRARPVTCI